MTDGLYVSTDADGVERDASGQVAWSLPGTGAGEAIQRDRLVLRTPVALLDVLDERIFLAEALGEAQAHPDGTVHTMSARLVAATVWSPETSTRFALDCAAHVVGELGDLTLPHGRTLLQVIDDARQTLDGVEAEGSAHLGRLATVRALRRLRKERTDLSNTSLGVMFRDEERDVDAFEDPTYAEITPVIDAVLAAIEALRHHALPHLYMGVEDHRENHEEHAALEDEAMDGTPVVVETPIGAVITGAPSVLSYEPSWSAAREAARHAREAAADRDGDEGAAAELAWQGEALAALLSEPAPASDPD